MDLDKDLNSAAVFSEKFAPYEIAAASTPPPPRSHPHQAWIQNSRSYQPRQSIKIKNHQSRITCLSFSKKMKIFDTKKDEATQITNPAYINPNTANSIRPLPIGINT
ncbi:hypothetical protein [Burkholderia gladioli]|uniref:hypothetical protein n=1 Tax=Burkholderia gladioli TaxID=28095 RepID=UPI0034DB6E34